MNALEIAKEKIAKFKFMDVDVLIIDEIGKNISGNGYDPNIVGRNISNSFSGILNMKKLFIRNTDKEAVLICIKSCSGIDYDKARVARIKNTLLMDEIQVSEALYNDIKERNDVEFLVGPEEMKFDSDGFII